MVYPTKAEVFEGRFKHFKFGCGAELIQAQELNFEMSKPIREKVLHILGGCNRNNRVLTEGQVTVSFVDDKTDSECVRKYFKLSIAGKEYFLKKIPRKFSKKYGGGVDEVIRNQKVRQLLQNEAGVEVVDYKIGFSDDQYTYLVSGWQDCLQTNLRSFIDNSDGQLSLELGKRFNSIYNILRCSYSVHSMHNASYDPKRDVIILYDLD